MNWLLTALTWYACLAVLGLIFLPLSMRIFSSFFDKGYAFSKTLAILIVSYVTLIFGVAKIAPFDRLTLLIILGLAVVTNITLLFKEKIFRRQVNKKNKYKKVLAKSSLTQGENTNSKRSFFFIILFEELLFLLSFLFLSFVRGQEPSIHGLEKFMDFGFINSILKSQFFPPLDMWLSADPTRPNGYPINYYYFGHLTGAVLIKLSAITPSIGYNLILATIYAQGVTLVFSFASNIIYLIQKTVFKAKAINYRPVIMIGIITSWIANLGGNLHTIYLFTKGYTGDNPMPFWTIINTFDPNKFSTLFGLFDPTKYWYPNATRFIPFTIHEFPAYSYVVADLHGHVFDIPFVLLTLALIFVYFLQKSFKSKDTHYFSLQQFSPDRRTIIFSIIFGFMGAVHYMTNAFDGPIYLLLIATIFFFSIESLAQFVISILLLVGSFLVFSYPFSAHFIPFVSGIGVNCAPDFLTAMKKLGPFLFEAGNCQTSALWMLFVLWGFFWVCFSLFILTLFIERRSNRSPNQSQIVKSYALSQFDFLIFILFAFSTFLIFIPEFFYIKDIYPAHFRANTMFKLGYQAFIMMSIASGYTLYRISLLKSKFKYILKAVYAFFFFFVCIYSFFSFPAYYGQLNKPANLDGATWFGVSYPDDKEITDYINNSIRGPAVILEAPGDSYTDYERISAYTGFPTVAGWWVHEWLWRGSADVVGKRVGEIKDIYESPNIDLTLSLLSKYHVSYVVVSGLERSKYPGINEEKFKKIGKKIFTTRSGSGALYQLK